jgi:DNA-binding response OmpR family regulator
MHHILLVDDDPVLSALLCRVLTEAGYQVRTAADGQSALQLLAEAPVDVLISDVLMPGLAGWSLLTRARHVRPTLPVLLISGVDAGLAWQEVPLHPPTHFLRKPFDLEEVLVVVRLLTGGASSEDRAAAGGRFESAGPEALPE